MVIGSDKNLDALSQSIWRARSWLKFVAFACVFIRDVTDSREANFDTLRLDIMAKSTKLNNRILSIYSHHHVKEYSLFWEAPLTILGRALLYNTRGYSRRAYI